MTSIALALAFLLELVAFVSFAAFGYAFHLQGAVAITAFVTAFALLIVFWSLFMAPRAPRKFGRTKYYLAKAVIYAVSAASLFVLKSPGWAAIFTVVAIIDELVLYRHNLS